MNVSRDKDVLDKHHHSETDDTGICVISQLLINSYAKTVNIAYRYYQVLRSTRQPGQRSRDPQVI